MELPPARKQSDPRVRPTSATAPLSQDREGRESGGIYFRTGGASSNAESGNAPRHTTTTRRITTGHATTRHTTTRHLEQPARSVFRGTLDYSETHRRWYVDLDPAPTGGSTESGNTEDDNAKGGGAINAEAILLADDLLLSGLKRGDYVELEGRIEKPASLPSDLPIVKTLGVLNFRSRDLLLERRI